MLNQKGSSQAIVIIFMAAILGSTSLVIDIGNSYINKAKLNNATDAAALAAALELPNDPNKAIQIAEEYLSKNAVNLEDVNITLLEDNSGIEVSVNKNVNHLFARVIGIESSIVNASSTVKIGPITEVYDGIRPFAVEEQTFNYGQVITLKYGAGAGNNGNYGAIALGGRGAKNYQNNIKYGYDSKLKVGDYIDTEPGNMVGPTVKGINYILDSNFETFENHSKNSTRLWTIPIVDSLNVNGRKPVKIVGFAEFFIEGVNNKAEITGRFIEFVKNGNINFNQNDYGLRAIKLVN